MVGEIELRVRAANSIVAGTAYGGCALTIDEDGSDIRALENVAFHSQNRELLARNAETRRELAQLACLYLQKSDVVTANLTCKLHAVIDRHRRAIVSQADSTGEESLIFSLPAKKKHARILQKEISLLWEEDRETRKVDDLIIYLGLTKVGIDRELCGQRGHDAKLRDFDSEAGARTGIKSVGANSGSSFAPLTGCVRFDLA